MSLNFPSLCRSNSEPDIHNHISNCPKPSITVDSNATDMPTKAPLITTPIVTNTINISNGNLNNSFTNSSNTLVNVSFSNSRECISNEDEDDSDIDNDDDDNNTSNSLELKNYMKNKSFRRHSSQQHIIMNALASNLNSSTERICSSPINTLKMSSRVCQIKIDEGIELHLSREIKSERDIQNTLKLKSSYDELNLTYDDDQSSSSSSSSKFKRYRTSSDSLNGNHTMQQIAATQTNIFNQSPLSPSSAIGLLRCYSPSLNVTNYSPNPSPTNKLFITRRSMSPINLKQTTTTSQSIKRKFSDIDNTNECNNESNTEINLANSCLTAKRAFYNDQNKNNKVSNNNNNQFAQPLVINTNLTSFSSTNSNSQSTIEQNLSSSSNNSNNNNFQSPSVVTSSSNKYTFIPIQNPTSSAKQQRPNNINLITTASINSNSPINSPAACYCDSPSSYHSSLSIISASEKPDSGYQSSVQNNSDSESCI